MESKLVENDKYLVPNEQKCANRWKTMTQTYERTINHHNISGNDRQECPYFQQMQEICGKKPNITPLATLSSNNIPSLIDAEEQEDGDAEVDQNEQSTSASTANSATSFSCSE